jgi:transposase-like protein
MGIGNSFKKIFSTKDKSHLKCHVCNKTLSNEDELDKHMKTAHKGYYGKLE